MSGIPNTYDNTSTLQQRLHQSSVQMPIGYVVSPNGRTGAELRIARTVHELVATGKSARLGKLLPHLTTTTMRRARFARARRLGFHPPVCAAPGLPGRGASSSLLLSNIFFQLLFGVVLWRATLLVVGWYPT